MINIMSTLTHNANTYDIHLLIHSFIKNLLNIHDDEDTVSAKKVLKF